MWVSAPARLPRFCGEAGVGWGTGSRPDLRIGRRRSGCPANDLSAGPGSRTSLPLQALGRSEDALAAFNQALVLDPGLAAAHENKGIALAVIGDFDGALAELDAAGRLAPTGAGEGGRRSYGTGETPPGHVIGSRSPKAG